MDYFTESHQNQSQTKCQPKEDRHNPHYFSPALKKVSGKTIILQFCSNQFVANNYK